MQMKQMKILFKSMSLSIGLGVHKVLPTPF